MAASDGRPISPHTENARRLRRNATIPERMLWNRLRGGNLAGLTFRRQQPIGPYIVDFFCHEVGLFGAALSWIALRALRSDSSLLYDAEMPAPETGELYAVYFGTAFHLGVYIGNGEIVHLLRFNSAVTNWLIATGPPTMSGRPE